MRSELARASESGAAHRRAGGTPGGAAPRPARAAAAPAAGRCHQPRAARRTARHRPARGAARGQRVEARRSRPPRRAGAAPGRSRTAADHRRSSACSSPPTSMARAAPMRWPQACSMASTIRPTSACARRWCRNAPRWMRSAPIRARIAAGRLDAFAASVERAAAAGRRRGIARARPGGSACCRASSTCAAAIARGCSAPSERAARARCPADRIDPGARRARTPRRHGLARGAAARRRWLPRLWPDSAALRQRHHELQALRALPLAAVAAGAGQHARATALDARRALIAGGHGFDGMPSCGLPFHRQAADIEHKEAS